MFLIYLSQIQRILPKGKQNDMDFVFSLINDTGASPVNIVDVVCLGARSSDNSLPLRVQFKDLSHKRSALVKAKKLRESLSSTFKGVFINPDLSFKETQAQRELKKELAARKEKGETGHT